LQLNIYQDIGLNEQFSHAIYGAKTKTKKTEEKEEEEDIGSSWG
jgi:hypothetical protein